MGPQGCGVSGGAELCQDYTPASGLHVGTAPRGLGSVVAASPGATACHAQAHRGPVCSRLEGLCLLTHPCPVHAPTGSGEVGGAPGGTQGSHALQAQTQCGDKAQCASRTTGGASPCFHSPVSVGEEADYPTGPGGPARERRPQAHLSGHHVPGAWLSSPQGRRPSPAHAELRPLPDGHAHRLHL